ncbi:dipeptidase [Aneurinibacillus danicus]|uniref:Dipeptidase n=2 Tax=Aneurinibacillus danicus TaxID=267746 RepID=A0A511VCQ4_9BACL|nr:dipeptidase [Aneurinibacillus danicus]
MENTRVLMVNGTIFDGRGGDPVNGAIMIEGDKIVSVGSTEAFLQEVAEEVPRIDLGGRFVMPGLVEAHAHLSYYGANSVQDLDLNSPVEETVINAVLNAKTMLRSGYTSAISFGSISRIDVAIRDAINAGKIEGPRYLACGRDVTATGGMPDWNPDYLKLGMEGLGIKADGPWELRKAIRSIRKNGADVVKIYIDGEGMLDNDYPGELAYTEEEVCAAVDEAHRRGLLAVCHARGAEAVRIAVRAGMDIIGHANVLDDETVELLRSVRDRIFVVPAIEWHVGLYERGAEFGVTKEFLDANGYQEEINESISSVKRLKEAGVRVLPGGDFGFNWSPHGTYARDLQNFVEYFGYTPKEVLLAATRDAGAAMKPRGMIGTLESGKFADLIVVEGNPLEDVRILQEKERIVGVMKGGKWYHNDFVSSIQPTVSNLV